TSTSTRSCAAADDGGRPGGRAPLSMSDAVLFFSPFELVVVARQNGDRSRHWRSEVPVGVLNAAFGPRRDGLVELIEMRVEAAVVDEGTRVRETKVDGSAVGLQKLVRALVARGVEG